MTIETDRELARLREMTAAEKLAVAEALWREAWALKRASLASLHPDWSAEQLDGDQGRRPAQGPGGRSCPTGAGDASTPRRVGRPSILPGALAPRYLRAYEPIGSGARGSAAGFGASAGGRFS